MEIKTEKEINKNLSNIVKVIIERRDSEISYLNKKIRELEKENYKLRFKKNQVVCLWKGD